MVDDVATERATTRRRVAVLAVECTICSRHYVERFWIIGVGCYRVGRVSGKRKEMGVLRRVRVLRLESQGQKTSARSAHTSVTTHQSAPAIEGSASHTRCLFGFLTW